jgi:hypothetical protein
VAGLPSPTWLSLGGLGGWNRASGSTRKWWILNLLA